MNTSNIPFETKAISALVKVFADEELQAPAFRKASALRNETFSFQVAYRSAERIKNIRVGIDSELKEDITVRRVGLVPSEYPVRDGHDGYVLRTAPGLYPDPLYPLEADGLVAIGGQWRSVWIRVQLKDYTPAGIHPIRITFETEQGVRLGEETFALEVIPCVLPKMTLIRTEWFYLDCIATYYDVDIFNEEHWTLIDRFLQTAVKNGINMILTPLFTPPLDTQVGGERPTVQLVDVAATDGRYTFGFDKLKRWVELCRSRGVEYFEFSHLFTQWGAKHAPKIVGTVNGVQQKLFGWETDAAGPEYKAFLDQFLPELVAFLGQTGLETQQCYFHVSDEPHLEHLEAYAGAAGIIDKHLSGFSRIDALSDFAFYQEGLVPIPIPASNHIEPFLEHKVPGLWTYYCNSQYVEVSNRFLAHPAARTRIIGMQLYKFDIKGFLHWGYNFWYSQLSKRAVNPYQVTDCDYAFPSGDAFVVYPGPDGPVESLRLVVFHDALQDLRALQLLESYIGAERVKEILEEGLDTPVTFSKYPREDSWLLAKREQVNRLIQSYASGKGK